MPRWLLDRSDEQEEPRIDAVLRTIERALGIQRRKERGNKGSDEEEEEEEEEEEREQATIKGAL